MSAPLARGLLEESLGGDAFVRRLELRGAVVSTNDLALELGRAGAPSGTVVIADSQSAGRGRRGSPWHSPPGLGLYISVLLRPAAQVRELTRWTLGAAVAACDACRRLSGAGVVIRWPNDLLWSGRKLGGVIAELRSAGTRARELVVGAGLNVGHRECDWPPELAGRTASLRLAAPAALLRRELLAAAYLRELGQRVAELEGGGWSAVARRWERLAPTAVGAPVRVRSRAGERGGYDGVTAGLDELGALRVRQLDGRIASVRQAESVRGLDPAQPREG